MAESAYYLTTGRDSYGRLLAVISLGSPQVGDATTTVCSVEIVKSQAEAKKWYRRMMKEKPWVTRQ